MITDCDQLLERWQQSGEGVSLDHLSGLLDHEDLDPEHFEELAVSGYSRGRATNYIDTYAIVVSKENADLAEGGTNQTLGFWQRPPPETPPRILSWKYATRLGLTAPLRAVIYSALVSSC